VAEAEADRFTRIYREARPPVLAYAMRRTSPDAAREVVAETFLIAWRRLADVPDPALPWLLVVDRNVLADQRRGGRRFDALLAEVAARPPARPPAISPPTSSSARPCCRRSPRSPSPTGRRWC
jgi:DNA-directed RNA polymerase specialized sigma24 family protein